MKTTFSSAKPKKLIYGDYYKFFPGNDLMLDSRDNKNYYLEFEKHFINTLNKHAQKKAKVFRGNHKPHINKKLLKAIMKQN